MNTSFPVCLTFDVEERFHSHLCPPEVPRHWKLRPRIEQILDWLLEREQKATFFVVADLAEKYTGLIRRMADEGHEVASHSYSHIRMEASRARQCRDDIERSRQVLEDLSGQRVVGYRAPSWTAHLSDGWLWDYLKESGFVYDSSLFPIKTTLYGSWENPLTPCWLGPGLLEIPPSASHWGPIRIPFGGGFYFRLYPRWLTERLMQRHRKLGKPPVLYYHPWDFEPDEVIERGWLQQFIGHYNVTVAWDRLRGLTENWNSLRMADYAADLARRL